jgi:hypothetical protein
LLRRAVLAAWLAVIAGPAAAYSNAAEYLIAQEVSAACDGGAGTIAPEAVIERDLTGDGRADLILAHDGIACAGGRRSNACGAQVCSVMIYVRRGQLLELEAQLLGTGVTVEGGAVPEIRFFGHGGGARSIRWDGQAFR